MKKINLGFTLIELLVIIGILGVLAAILVATIDPFEQLKKSQDANVKNTALEFSDASIRYFTTHSLMPWANDQTCLDEVGTGNSLDKTPHCLADLVGDGELKQGFTSVTNILSQVYLSNCGNSVITCYNPDSLSQNHDPNTRYDKYGNLKVGCPVTKGISTDCYWCSDISNCTVPTGDNSNPVSSGGSGAAPTPTPTPPPSQCVPIPTNVWSNKSQPYAVTGFPVSCETVSNAATQYAACFTTVATNYMSCSRVELYVDNQLSGTIYGWPLTGNGYNVSWNTKNFANGWHEVFVRGYDFFSGVSDSSPIQLYVNNTTPNYRNTIQVSFSFFNNGQPLSGDAILYPSTSWISNYYELYIDGVYQPGAIKEQNTGSAQRRYYFHTLNYNNGVHTLILKVYDKTGIMGISSPVSVIVKN